MALTKESLDRLLTWLHPDRDEAGKTYVNIRVGLIKRFASHKCTVPEKLADDTIDRVASKLSEIVETYVGEPERYFHRVAYYILLEWIAKEPDETELTDDVPLPVEDEDDEDVEAVYECLDKCMDGLQPQKRYLIKNYYQGDRGTKILQRKELALKCNLELPALRVQALRIRQDLKGCIKNCLQALGHWNRV